MKKHFGKLTLVVALAMALVLGVAAFAETVAPEVPELPAAEATEPEQPAADAAATEDAANDEALKAALDAYHEARDAARQEELADELKGYVEAGKLTQAQADLILEYFSTRESRHDGQGRGNKGGHMNGSDGMNNGNMNNGNMSGGRGGRFNQQMPDRQQMQGQGRGPQGMSFAESDQMLPDAYTEGDI